MKLSPAQTGIDKVIKKTTGKLLYLDLIKLRLYKYVWKRTAFNTSISELEDWQHRFDPSWFLIIRIANPVIGQQLVVQKVEQERSAISAQGSTLDNG